VGTPEAVRKMLDELRSIGPSTESAANKEAVSDYDALILLLEKLNKERRMLVVQVDT
jgi:hypothetical protein